MILSALGLPFPHGFVSGNSHQNFPVGHPSWDYSRANSLYFGVPTELEANELPKGLVLGRDENIHIRHRWSTPLDDVGSHNMHRWNFSMFSFDFSTAILNCTLYYIRILNICYYISILTWCFHEGVYIVVLYWRRKKVLVWKHERGITAICSRRNGILFYATTLTWYLLYIFIFLLSFHYFCITNDFKFRGWNFFKVGKLWQPVPSSTIL